MGVTGAFKISVDSMGTLLMDLGISVSMKDINGMTVAVDGNYVLNSVFKAFTTDLTHKGKITTHVKGILDKILLLNKEGANQIWVFDNPQANPRKEATQKKRKEEQEKRGGKRLQPYQYEDIFRLLNIMSVPYIIAPPGIEGEQYAAWMTQPLGDAPPLCDVVYSADSDVLFFGGNMLRESRINKKKSYTKFNYESVISELDVSRDEFLVIAALLGHDMYPKLWPCTPKSVLEKVKTRNYDVPKEQLDESLAQYRINPLEWVNENGAPEMIKGDYSPDELVEWLSELGFNSTLLRKKISTYVPQM
jgi:5'-3' exonuclease